MCLILTKTVRKAFGGLLNSKVVIGRDIRNRTEPVGPWYPTRTTSERPARWQLHAGRYLVETLPLLRRSIFIKTIGRQVRAYVPNRRALLFSAAYEL